MYAVERAVPCVSIAYDRAMSWKDLRTCLKAQEEVAEKNDEQLLSPSTQMYRIPHFTVIQVKQVICKQLSHGPLAPNALSSLLD